MKMQLLHTQDFLYSLFLNLKLSCVLHVMCSHTPLNFPLVGWERCECEDESIDFLGFQPISVGIGIGIRLYGKVR